MAEALQLKGNQKVCGCGVGVKRRVGSLGCAAAAAAAAAAAVVINLTSWTESTPKSGTAHVLRK